MRSLSTAGNPGDRTARTRFATLDVNYVHEHREQPQRQRVVRIYDPDLHIVEVGEFMESVAKRPLAGGALRRRGRRTHSDAGGVRQAARVSAGARSGL